MFCMRMRSCASANHAKIMRSRDGQCNTKESPEKKVSLFDILSRSHGILVRIVSIIQDNLCDIQTLAAL